MRAQPMGRRGRFDQRSWLGRLRDAVDSLVSNSPSRFAILIFAGLVLLFTVLFSLPIASADRQVTPLHDALFTAVSVICVTGLATVDMATHWSPFGNTLVFIGVNIGGIGVLTLASILGLVISRRLGLRAKLIAASDTNPSRIHVGPVAERQAVRLGEVGGLLATVAISALVIEVTIAMAMIPSMLAADTTPCTRSGTASTTRRWRSRTPGSARIPAASSRSCRTTGSSPCSCRASSSAASASPSSSRWHARGGSPVAGACT